MSQENEIEDSLTLRIASIHLYKNSRTKFKEQKKKRKIKATNNNIDNMSTYRKKGNRNEKKNNCMENSSNKLA